MNSCFLVCVYLEGNGREIAQNTIISFFSVVERFAILCYFISKFFWMLQTIYHKTFIYFKSKKQMEK